MDSPEHMEKVYGRPAVIPPLIQALEAIQESHRPKHGERPVYETSNHHGEPIGWAEYTICANCHTAYPCDTRKLADAGLGEAK